MFGISMEFFIGDVEKIIQTVESSEVTGLENPVVVERKAVFDLHLSPNDLNSLSLEVGIITREEPLLLRPHLSPIIDEVDHGLLAVDPKWVAYFSRLPIEETDHLTENWFFEMEKDYDEPVAEVNEFVRKAVLDLVNLCKYAVNEECQVVYYWQA